MYSPKKIAGSPQSGQRGVNYFNHFPRQRLIPYGQISEATSDKTMLDKANSINCEYLIRPKIAMSEFAETVQSNMNLLVHKCEKLDFESVSSHIYKLDEVMKVFNTKNNQTVSSKDVRNVLKYFIEDNCERDDAFDNLEHLGMMMYTIASHQKQVRALVRDPRIYSLKCENLNASEGFKSSPSITTLKDWWSKELVTEETKAPLVPTFSRRSLLEELGCSSGSEGESEQVQMSSKVAKKRRLESVSSSKVSSISSGLKESATSTESVLKSAKKQKLGTTCLDKGSKVMSSVTESAKKSEGSSVPAKWRVPLPSSSDEEELSRKSKDSAGQIKSKKEKKSKHKHNE